MVVILDEVASVIMGTCEAKTTIEGTRKGYRIVSGLRRSGVVQRLLQVGYRINAQSTYERTEGHHNIRVLTVRPYCTTMLLTISAAHTVDKSVSSTSVFEFAHAGRFSGNGNMAASMALFSHGLTIHTAR